MPPATILKFLARPSSRRTWSIGQPEWGEKKMPDKVKFESFLSIGEISLIWRYLRSLFSHAWHNGSTWREGDEIFSLCGNLSPSRIQPSHQGGDRAPGWADQIREGRSVFKFSLTARLSLSQLWTTTKNGFLTALHCRKADFSRLEDLRDSLLFDPLLSEYQFLHFFLPAANHTGLLRINIFI